MAQLQQVVLSKFDANGNIIGAAVAPVPEKKETPAVEEVKTPAAPAVEEVKTPAAPVPEKKETPAVKEVKTPAAPAVEEVKTPAAPEKIELTGVLTRYKFSTSKDTEYVLLTAPNGYNQAFVTGDSAVLSANENKKVKITGSAAGRFGENGAIIVKIESVSAI